MPICVWLAISRAMFTRRTSKSTKVVALGSRRVVDRIAVFEARIAGNGKTHDHDAAAVGRRLDGGRLEDVVERIDIDVVESVLHIEGHAEAGRGRIHHLDGVLLGIPRSITVILLERRTDDLAAARRKAERQHVVLHRELPASASRAATRSAPIAATCCSRRAARATESTRGESRRIGFNDRLCGSQRILVGLPFGHLLLVFLLFFRIEVGKAHEEQGNYDTTNDRFFYPSNYVSSLLSAD